MVQQLVLVRPEMIVPLEEIVRGVLSHILINVADHQREPDDERRVRGRAPLPPVALSELPTLKALLDSRISGVAGAVPRHRAARRREKKKG
jgi:hypothetical protein